jgi:UDP-sugar transporter A1/2/3
MAEPTLNLLSTYIGAETIRSNCEYYLFRTTSGVSPPVALVLSEFLALTVAAICLRREPSEALSESPDLRCLQKLLRYAIPAALDLLARLICLAVADSTSSNLLQLFITSRIPATSILHHLWIKKQRNGSAWSSLIWVCLGLFMLKIPPGHESKGLFVTFVAGFAVAAVTAFSNVASETLSKSGMFWESQFWLYAWGTLFSVFSYPLTSAMSTIPLQGTEGQEPASMENLVFLIIYIVTTVVVRITTGVILRRKDNLTILVATTTALLISATTLYYISTALRATNMTSWTIIGGLVTAIATWRYYHYIGHGTNQYDSVSVDEYRDAIPLHTYTLVPAIPRSIQEADAAEKQECIPEIADAESDVDFLLSNDEALSFTEVFNATTFGLLPSALPTLKRLQMGVRSVFIFLLPSFMPFASSEIASPSKKLHLTAWLDGLRGVASLCVGFQHTIIYEFPRGLNGWNGTTQNMFIQLPWIRLFLAGHPMVAIFFVVSGFSLSYGPLKRIGANDFSGMASSLSSSVLRRPFRLYLPCIPVTFITMLTVYFRLDGGKLGVGVWPFPNQFWHWANDLIYMMNPFTTIDLAHWQKLCSPYLPNIWTIPLEFRGSYAHILI